jgi:transcriptional regulator GlxA family with amidase domain
MDRRIAAAIEVIQSDKHHRMRVSELARRVNLSVGRFARLFKAETSLSPKDYVRQLRLRRAKELLENTFLRVNEVAAQVGFRHASSFVRDFKMRYGYTPSTSRRRMDSLPPKFSVEAESGPGRSGLE